MFISKIEEDKYGKTQTHFWLTQGDSCGIISIPKNEVGEVVESNLINYCKFKLIDDKTNKILFEKPLSLMNNRYVLNLLATETNNFNVGKYKYEIEYTFVDGGVNTPNQWKFYVIEQGITEV